MTYNFDPELWYDNHLALLETHRASGKLDEAGYRKSLDDLDRKYQEMLDRLDGTYQLSE